MALYLFFSLLLCIFTCRWSSQEKVWWASVSCLAALFWYEGHDWRCFDPLQRKKGSHGQINAITHPSVDEPPLDLKVLQGGKESKTSLDAAQRGPDFEYTSIKQLWKGRQIIHKEIHNYWK